MENNYSFIDGYRLNKLQSHANNVNWLLLPGGPGMGSEYLIEFASKLGLPGNVFIGDFPGDGSNLDNNNISYNYWKAGLLKVLEDLAPCVLVTHSFSAMLALTIPAIENLISGLIIINSSPSNKWITLLNETATTYNLPNLTKDITAFYTNPTDEQLKTFFQANIPYLFANHEVQQGQELLDISSYNANAKIWGDQNFHISYSCTWVPQKLPTIIIGSHDDRLLPIRLFLEHDEWVADNIKIIALTNTGHFPWLSHFDLIKKTFSNFANDVWQIKS